MREQETDIGILNFEKQAIEVELSTLKDISGRIEQVPLRLDLGDPYQFLANYARVGLIKERLLDKTIPHLQSELERVTQAVEPAKEAVVDEAAAKLLEKFERDIQGVELSRNTQKLIDYMKISLGEVRSIPEEELEDQVLGEQAFKRARREVLNDRLFRARPALRGIGWDIVDTRAKKGSSPGEYRLVPLEKETEEKEVKEAFPPEGKISHEVEVVGEEPIDRLTQEEAAVIATLLANNRDMLAKYGFEDFPRELADRLGLGIELKLDKVGLDKFRMRALEHLRQMLSNEYVEKIYDDQTEDIRSLFVYFIDREKALDLLRELLSANIERSWRISQGGEVVDFTLVVVPRTSKAVAEAPKPQGGQTIFEVREKPFVPEVCSPLENGILRILIDQMSKHTKLNFLELQKALYRLAVEVNAQDRFAIFKERRHFKVFQPNELYKIFSEAFRKIQLPGIEDAESLSLLSNLSSIMERISGRDTHKFQRSVGALVEDAERVFYNTYQPVDGDKVIWLDIDRLGA